MSQHATGGAAAKTGRIFIGDLVVAVDDESVLNKTVSEVGMVMPLSPWVYAYDRCFVACGCVRVGHAARAWVCHCMGASMHG